MGRSFGSRILRDIQEIFEPEDTLHDSEPENEYVTGAEQHPTEGDPARGIPAYPAPLPGAHEYAGKPVITRQRVNVPPAKPYYSAGMAHGVKAPEHHDGRIAPQHHERRGLETDHEHEPEIGHYKLEPIPVYISEPGAGIHPLRQATFRSVTVVLGNDPVAIVERDPNRKRVLLLNEAAAGGAIRLLNGPNIVSGALLPAAMTNYRSVETQDQIWAVSDPAATISAVISIIQENKIESA